MYSPANQEHKLQEPQSQPNSRLSQSQPLYASKQSTLFKFASNTPRPRLFAPQSQLDSIFVEGNNSETDDSASDVDQPLFPPSKRRRLLTPTTASNHIDDSECTSIQRSRKPAPTRGDSEELWSHARARRPGERERERKKKIWYCFYGNRDCPRNYNTTNYDNIRSHLKKRHGWRQATGTLSKMLAVAIPSQTSYTIANIDKTRLNRRLIDYITSSNIPFRTASNPLLHALLDEVLPGASKLLIKSHSTVAKHVKKEHDFYQEQLKALLATSRSLIHFTCDAWTANYGSHELLSITARFVDSDGKLSKALLALHKLSAGHAGAQCAPLFFNTIVTYGIEQKIGYITSDNATCNDTMMSHLATLFSERLSIDWDPIQHRTRCFGHQINLASQALMSASSTDTIAAVIDQSQDPLKAISTLAQGTGLTDHEALDYLRQFFEWIMRSARRRREFKAAAGVSPMLNNTTRWNSWLAMIKRGIQSRATIRAIQSANEHMEHTTLQRRHWQFLEALVDFMEPLQEVTKLCEGDNATLDQVLISMDFLRKHYEKYTQQDASTDQALIAAIRTSQFALNKWQAINNYTPAYAAALLLHPTYRENYIKQHWPPSWRTPAITAVRALWTAKYKNKTKPIAIAPLSNEEESNQLAKWQASIRFANSVTIPEEFVQFTKSPPVLVDDAIQWWLEPTQQHNYPNLSQMAIDILSINPMSAESERVFSGCRRTLSWDRASLSADNLGYIECLKSWQKNLCFDKVDLPITTNEGPEDHVEELEDDVEGQGDLEEGQGDCDDDDGVGIGIIPLDN
ncbi:unnamed protein product [Aureobasidium mustum]|uniref:HAT C-terminal dimerisation domain-containing protein n=1 Tax=Aureobasidium mustum TaxID=2773714 RepID=A0A9N8K4Q0_9PEZI|nr:unnamed protein product [Aureobasidium mustum]CAD0099662.1 unnamed protein product [Aureobasidium mustum]CAD0099686.1 unnamed protein product [Aureobasidium mustum]